jgi:hypothetical protein
LRRGEQHGAAWGTILKGAQYAQEQSLARRGEQIDAVEIDEAGEGRRVAIGGQPLARIAALKVRSGQRRVGEEVARQRVLAGAVFAFDGGNLQMGRGHFRLYHQLAPCGADADDLEGRLGLGFNERQPGAG